MGGLLKTLLFRFLYACACPLPPSYFRPFPFGGWLRRCFAKGMLEYVGDGANIETGAHFSENGRGVRIGARSGIGIRAQVAPYVTLGDDVMMGPDVLILTRNHAFGRTDVPMNAQDYGDYRPVAIEDDVWVGARAVILPGVRIGKGSIIGAAAVVTKSVPPYSIAGGNPARIIRSRIPSHD